MKLSKTGYTLILVACTIIFIFIISCTSIFTTVNILEENADKNMELTAQNVSLEFNATINSIEQCVNTISSSAIYHIEDLELFKTDADYLTHYTESLKNIMLYAAEHTTGAMSVYVRYNPEFTDPEVLLL